MKDTFKHRGATQQPVEVIGEYCPIPHFANRSFPDDLERLRICDAIRYAQAMRQTVEAYPEAFGPDSLSDKASEAAVRRVIGKPDFNTLICEEGGEIVAAISYARGPNATLELGYLFCLPKARGRALGRLLLRDALRMTKAKDDTVVRLSVRFENRSAIDLYEGLGFRPEYEMGGYIESADAMYMELRGEENIDQAIGLLTNQIMMAHAGSPDA